MIFSQFHNVSRLACSQIFFLCYIRSHLFAYVNLSSFYSSSKPFFRYFTEFDLLICPICIFLFFLLLIYLLLLLVLLFLLLLILLLLPSFSYVVFSSSCSCSCSSFTSLLHRHCWSGQSGQLVPVDFCEKLHLPSPRLPANLFQSQCLIRAASKIDFFNESLKLTAQCQKYWVSLRIIIYDLF